MAEGDGLHKRRGIWYWGYRGSDGRWHEVSTKTTVYAEARTMRDDGLRRIRQGNLPTEQAKWTVQRAGEEWLRHRNGRCASSTLRLQKSLLKPLERRLGQRTLASLTLRDVEHYQEVRMQEVSRRGGSISPRTVNLEMQMLAKLLKRARLWNKFEEHYERIPLPQQRVGRALTPEEQARLLATLAANPDWHVLHDQTVLALNTGMRTGEILNLRLGDIDLDGQRLFVRRGSSGREATKTQAGQRIVPLNPATLKAVEAMVKRAHELGARRPDHCLFPSDLLKHTKAADPLTGKRGFDVTRPQRSFKKAWKTAMAEAGLSGFRAHDRRWTFISRHAEAGTPIEVIQSIAGQFDAQTTRWYVQISAKAQRQAVEAVQFQPARAYVG